MAIEYMLHEIVLLNYWMRALENLTKLWGKIYIVQVIRYGGIRKTCAKNSSKKYDHILLSLRVNIHDIHDAQPLVTLNRCARRVVDAGATVSAVR